MRRGGEVMGWEERGGGQKTIERWEMSRGGEEWREERRKRGGETTDDREEERKMKGPLLTYDSPLDNDHQCQAHERH
jgi:hypothetical protein